MAIHIGRRDFITLLGGAAAAWPHEVLGEGRNRPPVVAWLWFGSPGGRLPERYGKAFTQGMRELGYVQGRDFIIVYRHADGHADRIPRLVAELLEPVQTFLSRRQRSKLSRQARLRQRLPSSFPCSLSLYDRAGGADDAQSIPCAIRSDRVAGQDAIPDTSAHAAAWLRLCPSQRRPRHQGAAGLARAQKHSAHGALHRAGTGQVQKLLARLGSRSP
jgi:hypothetical protein